ncbi:MAG: nitrile hydratase accessory protein [Rhodospirillales bacterium]|nr:nitrile hydratase accessory protein [Rhodospirillales bacterium]
MPENAPPIPLPEGVDGEGPVFTEPWHAQVFAITVKLSEAGHFTWTEWTEHFGATQKQAAAGGAPSDGSAYYDAWLAALESLLSIKGLADQGGLQNLKEAWTDAFLSTPHGEPVKLDAAGKIKPA